MNALGISKACIRCERTLPPDAFYRCGRYLQSCCKECHNGLCVERVKHSRKLQRAHAASKRAWVSRNPVRKRIHEGRSIFLHQQDAPNRLKTLEILVAQLGRKQS